MRPLALALAIFLVAGIIVPGRARASTADLVQQLDALVASFPGGAGLWIGDPAAAPPLFTHDAGEQVLAASLYKLGVLAEAERRVEARELRYDDRIVIGPEDVTEDGSFVGVGAVLTIDEALEAMITISDNGSALALWRLLGGANIDTTLERAGMPGFHVAIDETEDNAVTPEAIGTFFTLLVKRRLISPAASDRMLARLERQQINDRLPAQLPADVVVAHKTGNLVGATHDAGIIYTKSGPRVVVAMTWDAPDDDAYSFISSVGALVYGANLEPAANARYQVPRSALSVDVGSVARVAIPITNIGTRAWSASGAGSVGLIWELRDRQRMLLASSARPEALPALQPNQAQSVSVDVTVPLDAGTYTVTIGLTDASGTALAYAGAATATFTLRAHRPYLATAQIQMPRALHQREPSLVAVSYSALPGAGEQLLDLSWRAVERRTNRIVQEGSSVVGRLKPGASGTFFAAFTAPSLLGTYRLTYELSDGRGGISEPASVTVEILGPRSYPDDDGGRSLPVEPAVVTPTPIPRFQIPQVTIPKPPFPLPLRGRPPTP